MTVKVNGLPCDICGGAVRHVPGCSTLKPRQRRIFYVDVSSVKTEDIEGYFLGIQDVLQQINDDETLRREMSCDPNFCLEIKKENK